MGLSTLPEGEEQWMHRDLVWPRLLQRELPRTGAGCPRKAKPAASPRPPRYPRAGTTG